MMNTEAPIDSRPMEQCSLKHFLDALASYATVPGAGAASGVVLALGAACAGKAIAITRRHDDSAELAPLEVHLAELRESALKLAEADALLFKQHLESSDQKVDAQLLRTDRRILDACRDLTALLTKHEHRIAGNMRGDWQAAAVLSQASRSIQEINVRELEEE